LITSGKENSPTTRNLKNTEIEPLLVDIKAGVFLSRFLFMTAAQCCAMDAPFKTRKGAMMKWRYG